MIVLCNLTFPLHSDFLTDTLLGRNAQKNNKVPFLLSWINTCWFYFCAVGIRFHGGCGQSTICLYVQCSWTSRFLCDQSKQRQSVLVGQFCHRTGYFRRSWSFYERPIRRGIPNAFACAGAKCFDTDIYRSYGR